ncbi:Protein of unknown function [Cotesia congregata]|uniref:Uncharacterized protein n=1 Tax=Cotesia congregata TaxID=51543 RepID=A0A8J2MKR7_COTCN|nr:Protein of unknown function [Cotesia congregata]
MGTIPIYCGKHAENKFIVVIKNNFSVSKIMSDRVKKYRALKKYMDNRSQPPNTPSLLIDNDHNTNDHDHNNLSSETIVNSVVNKENNYGAFVSDNESSLSDCVDDSYQSIYPAESEVIISNETDTDSSDSNNQSIAEENVKCEINNSSDIVFEGNLYSSVSSITIKQNYLSSNRPDNIILLKNNKVIIIDQLLTTKTNVEKTPKLNEIYILGRQMLNAGNLFDYPTPSKDVAIRLTELENDKIFQKLSYEDKCNSYISVKSSKNNQRKEEEISVHI